MEFGYLHPYWVLTIAYNCAPRDLLSFFDLSPSTHRLIHLHRNKICKKIFKKIFINVIYSLIYLLYCVVCLGTYTKAHVIQLCGVCYLLPRFHGFRDGVQGTRLAQACASPTEPSIFIAK